MDGIKARCTECGCEASYPMVVCEDCGSRLVERSYFLEVRSI